MNRKEALALINRLLSTVDDIKLVQRQQEQSILQIESLLIEMRQEFQGKPIGKKEFELSDEVKLKLLAGMTRRQPKKL